MSERLSVFVQFLLIDIKHDTVSNCSKVTFCCLALVFNFDNKCFKKSYVKSGKLQIGLQKRKEQEKYIPVVGCVGCAEKQLLQKFQGNNYVLSVNECGNLTTFGNPIIQLFLNYRMT